MENGDKVEQYLLLAKNARGLALADLVAKCTAEPGLFTFGEILALPGVQEVRRAGAGVAGCSSLWRARRAHVALHCCLLFCCEWTPPCMPQLPSSPHAPSPGTCAQLRQSEHSSAYELLQLYAYGSWDEYRGGRGGVWGVSRELFDGGAIVQAVLPCVGPASTAHPPAVLTLS